MPMNKKLEEIAKIDKELKHREKYWPIKDAIPNIAQERALSCYMTPHPTYVDKYPFIMIFRAGNGGGKTCDLAWLLAGVSLGPEFMNKTYFRHQYFYDCMDIRRKRALKVRIVCDKADMQENGSVFEQISKWIPIARYAGFSANSDKRSVKRWFEDKTSGGYYTKIRIPAPTPEFIETVVDIKTFDQDTVAHAGPDYDIILFNEPPPQDKFNENIGRCRTGGRIAVFLTPLDAAEYLQKMEMGDYPDGEFFVTEASIWENCADVAGSRGVLSKSKIESLIRAWRENNELEVPAREHGKYVSLAGAIFPIYNSNVHEIEPIEIDPCWNVYKIIDPHEAKPPFCIWVAVTPLGDSYVIAEYPTASWPAITSTYLTIENFVQEFKLIESGKNSTFSYIRKPLIIDECYGDPTFFGTKLPNTAKTIKQTYEEVGCETIITNFNDGVAYRHDRARKLLLYDYQRKVDSINKPKAFVFKSCKNVSRAFKNYQYKANKGMSGGLSDKIDKTWKCPMACFGYFAVNYEGYRLEYRDRGGNYVDPEILAIDRSRNSQYIEDELDALGRFI